MRRKNCMSGMNVNSGHASIKCIMLTCSFRAAIHSVLCIAINNPPPHAHKAYHICLCKFCKECHPVSDKYGISLGV